MVASVSNLLKETPLLMFDLDDSAVIERVVKRLDVHVLLPLRRRVLRLLALLAPSVMYVGELCGFALHFLQGDGLVLQTGDHRRTAHKLFEAVVVVVKVCFLARIVGVLLLIEDLARLEPLSQVIFLLLPMLFMICMLSSRLQSLLCALINASLH